MVVTNPLKEKTLIKFIPNQLYDITKFLFRKLYNQKFKSFTYLDLVLFQGILQIKTIF